MNSNRKREFIYDVVVVGSGISGLIVAVECLKKGLEVCLIDSADFAGGHSRLIYSPIGMIDNGIKYIPDNSSGRAAIEKLETLLGKEIKAQFVESGPITYHGGELKPFVGFGKAAPLFHREISYYLDPVRIEIEPKIGSLVGEMISILGDRFIPQASVTKLNGKLGEVQSITINGQKNISGKQFVMACSPKVLNLIHVDEVFSSKIKQKLAKNSFWTAVTLDLFHKGRVSSRAEIHLLDGTTQDEIGPCVGLFHDLQSVPTGDLEIQRSQWVTFVDDESSEDPEIIGVCLKKIKRQIKRAYPAAFDGSIPLYSEKITINPYAEGDLDSKIIDGGRLNNMDNLWLAHSSVSGISNLAGAITQGFEVSSQLQKVISHHQPYQSDEQINLNALNP